jgi:hypothetical protein
MPLTLLERNQLIDLLTDHFNIKELKDLCNRLGIDSDRIDSSSKETLVSDLLFYLERRLQISTLIEIGKKQRPELNWPNLVTAEPKPSPVTKTEEKNSSSSVPLRQNNIFISYSHRDETWKDLLVKHLKVLENQGLVASWDDRQIRAGDDWAQQIEQAAAQARLAILLISDDFLASKFIMQQEVPYFLQRRNQGDLIVFPIIITDCFWDIIDWLKVIQVRPKDGKPLAEFEEAQRDKVIKEMVREIYNLLATPI